MENYFLIHRWFPVHVPHVVYKEQKLQRLYRTFGSPSMRGNQSLLERANGRKIGVEDNQCLGKREGWLQNVSKEINRGSKILVDRWHSGAEVQSSGIDEHDVYSMTISDPQRGRGDAILCSITHSKAVQERKPRTEYSICGSLITLAYQTAQSSLQEQHAPRKQ